MSKKSFLKKQKQKNNFFLSASVHFCVFLYQVQRLAPPPLIMLYFLPLSVCENLNIMALSYSQWKPQEKDTIYLFSLCYNTFNKEKALKKKIIMLIY